jgi:hypothetical protein
VEAFRFVRCKNRLDPAVSAYDSGGYRDCQCLVRIPSGWVVELQIIPDEIYAVRKRCGHGAYKEQRFVLEARKRAEGDGIGNSLLNERSLVAKIMKEQAEAANALKEHLAESQNVANATKKVTKKVATKATKVREMAGDQPHGLAPAPSGEDAEGYRILVHGDTGAGKTEGKIGNRDVARCDECHSKLAVCVCKEGQPHIRSKPIRISKTVSNAGTVMPTTRSNPQGLAPAPSGEDAEGYHLATTRGNPQGLAPAPLWRRCKWLPDADHLRQASRREGRWGSTTSARSISNLQSADSTNELDADTVHRTLEGVRQARRPSTISSV